MKLGSLLGKSTIPGILLTVVAPAVITALAKHAQAQAPAGAGGKVDHFA